MSLRMVAVRQRRNTQSLPKRLHYPSKVWWKGFWYHDYCLVEKKLRPPVWRMSEVRWVMKFAPQVYKTRNCWWGTQAIMGFRRMHSSEIDSEVVRRFAVGLCAL